MILCLCLSGWPKQGGGTKIKELFLSFYPSISGCEWRRGRSEKRGGRSVHERGKILVDLVDLRMASRCVHLAYTHTHTLSLTALRESNSMKAFEMRACFNLLDPNKHGVKQVQTHSQINKHSCYRPLQKILRNDCHSKV